MAARLVDVPTALASSGLVSVIGVVVDVFGSVWKSRGSSSCITFTIKDCDLNNGHTWDGLKIKYFKDDESDLPPVQNGDVILLRNIWLKKLHGKPLGVAAQDRNVPWAIFRHNTDPTSIGTPLRGPVPFELTHPETRRCRLLLEPIAGTKRFRDDTTPAKPPSAAPSSSSMVRPNPRRPRKFSLIQDIQQPGTFVDLVCEIIKVDTRDSQKTLVYVTDYTSNPNLRNYAPEGDVWADGDQYNYQSRKRTWPGPAGQRTLLVALWEPHAMYARSLTHEDLVQLSNVRIKEAPQYQQFEGVIHTDRYDEDKVLVERIDAEANDRAKELLRRKEEYWKQNPKRKAADEARPAPKAKKAKAKQGKTADARREDGQKSLSIHKEDLNQNVVASFPDSVCRTIEDILNNKSHENTSPDGIHYRLPFQNLSYRSTVRVVDFFPPKLEDFAVPVVSHNHHRSDERRITWEWRFCLLVESASPSPVGQPKQRMKLYMDDSSTQYLLNLDACDLRSNTRVLAELRERLFLLWGNLEEQKRQAAEHGDNRSIGAVSARPFVCCIQEYGVVCSHRAEANDFDEYQSGCDQDDCLGWEQRYAMFQTTIHA
ncbi:hypothetical protein BDV59DRAFT_177454 [Aspergillus ambiguus]|uniref:telomere-binding alpha subunit central domain protein n=1 Tax=Aspergillus ambiguus TaxID=176160 RepID=UPI003CCE4DBA